MRTLNLTDQEIAVLAQVLDNTPVKGVSSMLSILAIVKKLEEAMDDTGQRGQADADIGDIE
jgi:hypothetical protein